MKRLDVVIVGGGFAGLSAARSAAAAGMRVLVLERKTSAGAAIHTTGLLPPDAVEMLLPPRDTIGPRLDAVELVGPSGRGSRIERPGAGFTPTRTAALLRVMEERAIAAGAEIRHGVPVLGVVEHATGVSVVTDRESLRCDRVLAADGARSAVATSLGVRPNRRLLAGAEVHVEAGASEVPEDAYLLMLHGTWAPGYAAWAFRGCDGLLQVGLLGRASRSYRPALALAAFLRWLEKERGLVVRATVERRGGLVPAGGARRLSSKRVVLCGDAGGHVSAISAGGIGRALQAGDALGSLMADDPSSWRAIESEQARRAGGHRLLLAAAIDVASTLAAEPTARLIATPALGWLAEEILFRPAPLAPLARPSSQGLG